MGFINSGYIFFIVIGIGLVLIVLSLIKKAVKLVILIVILLLGYSLYNVVVKGVSPIDEINAYKTDIKYSQSIADYSSKIKNSVEKIKNLTSGNVDAAAVKEISAEDKNLHKYRDEVAALQYTPKLKAFQDKYLGMLDGIIASSDGIVKMADSGVIKNVSQLQNWVGKLSSDFSSLYSLKVQ